MTTPRKDWPVVRIVNLLVVAGVAVFFVAALGDPGLPQPHGWLENFLFYAGGSCALLWLLIDTYVGWSDWRDDRRARSRP